MVTVGAHLVRTLPVPELQDGRTSGEYSIPVWLTFLLDRVNQIRVVVESERAVCGLFGVTELGRDLVRPVRQDFRSLFEMHLLDGAVADGKVGSNG